MFENWRIYKPFATAQATVAYGEIKNIGSQAIKIQSIQCNCAKSTFFHQMIEENGKLRMQTWNEILLAPSQKVILEPGKNHVMLFDFAETGQGCELTIKAEGLSQISFKTPVIERE